MAKNSKTIALDKGTSLFSGSSQSLVERLLKKAAEQAFREAERKWKAPERNPFAMPARPISDDYLKALRNALTGALIYQSNNSGERPSLRLTAPDTGGRPFHFAHTSVSTVTINLEPGATAPSPSTNGGIGSSRDKFHTSSPGRHMEYLERDGAIETLDADLEMAAGIGVKIQGGGRERSPGSMQEYIEDQTKDEGLRKDAEDEFTAALAFSYGTIGETLEERIAFWDLAEEHARGKRGTIQHRLIMELPYEATPHDRVAIMKAFTAKFDDDHVPYHVVIHAPTAKNDSRNYHAHVVFLGRPAAKTPWPLGGKVLIGPEGPITDTWDFAAKSFLPDRFRVTSWRYPKRQNVHPDYRQDMVPLLRQRFSEIVNARMTEVGNPVRYDHRAYRGMGLDIEAMKSVSRIRKDKTKRGGRIVLSEAQTKRDIENEFQRIRRERAPEYAEVANIRAAARKGVRELRKVEQDAGFLGGKPIIRRATDAVHSFVREKALDYARKKALHLERSIEAAQEVRSLERVIEATQPDAIDALRKRLDANLKKATEAAKLYEAARLRKELYALPETSQVRILHDIATNEVETLRAKHDNHGIIRLARVRAAMREWRAAARGAKPVLPLPAAPGAVSVEGISFKARAMPPLDIKPPKPDQHPIWTSYDEVVDQTFHTGFQKFMAGVFKRYGQFILDNADPNVPGRTPLELAEKLTQAVKQNPAKAEELIMAHDAERRSREAALKSPVICADTPADRAARPKNHSAIPKRRTSRATPDDTEPLQHGTSPLERPGLTPVEQPAPQREGARKVAPPELPAQEPSSGNSEEVPKPKRKKRTKREERQRGILALRNRGRARDFER